MGSKQQRHLATEDKRQAPTSGGIIPWAALVRSLLTFIGVMWVIVTATFFLARAIPGGPFDQERYFPDNIRAQMEARYNLDEPLAKQYLRFLGGLARFDLGPSLYEQGRSVNEIIARAFPRSALLGGVALLFALAIGLPIGIVAALRQNQWPDYSSLFVAILGVSVPSFILASLLQYVFAFRMKGFLPASGLEGPRSLIMPCLALSSFALAFVIRLVRAEMIDVLSREYITAARARGLATWRIATKHALRNALLPVVTYLGPLIAALFTGSFVIETIFDIPGLGRQYVQSINNRDYSLILGVTVFYSALLVGLNMCIDLLYQVIDPRVRRGSGAA